MSAQTQAGLILPLGRDGQWDSAQVSCPRVIQLADNDWRLWYYGRDADFDPLVRLPTGRIGYATSTDGIHWQRIQGTEALGSVLSFNSTLDAFDSAHVGVGDVHQTAEGFEMWHFGGPAQITEVAGLKVSGFPLSIGRARSRDGVQWNRLPGSADGATLKPSRANGTDSDIVDDSFMAGWPQVMHLDDGRLRMYYHSYSPAKNQFFVCAAHSLDGDHWDKIGKIFGAGPPSNFDADGPATRHIIRHHGRWLMFYEGFNKMHASIGLAESKDGLDWQRIPGPCAGNAILARAGPGSGSWDAGAVGTPWVVPMKDNSLRMYYVGADERADRLEAEAGACHQIGMALCAGDDLSMWRRASTL